METMTIKISDRTRYSGTYVEDVLAKVEDAVTAVLNEWLGDRDMDAERAWFINLGSECGNCAKKDAEFKAFKKRIRDRMIQEADDRQWCGEFDEIIVEFGMQGRYGNFDCEADIRGYDTVSRVILAKNDNHARELMCGWVERVYGTLIYEVRVKRQEVV